MPQTIINSHAFDSMKRVGVASATCEQHTLKSSWGAFGKSPPLETAATVRLSVQCFRGNNPTSSLAVRRATRTRQLDAVPGPLLPYDGSLPDD